MDDYIELFSQLKHFEPHEFTRPGLMSPVLLRRLDRAREIAGRPFVITSSYRGGDPKTHGKGEAVDIRCHHSRERQIQHDALRKAGFNRIGLYDEHTHADVSTTQAQDVTWIGLSR